MINRICAYIHNWFDEDRTGAPYWRESGEFVITDGALELPELVDGEFFRIIGSKLNDGIYQYPPVAGALIDETFTGEVRECIVPRAVQDIAKDIKEWETDNAEVLKSPFNSESFGGYSYTRKSASSDGTVGDGLNWESVYGYRLQPWRKLYDAR